MKDLAAVLGEFTKNKLDQGAKDIVLNKVNLVETKYVSFLDRSDFFVNQIVNGEFEKPEKIVEQAVNALKHASFTLKILTDKEEKTVLKEFHEMSKLFEFKNFERKDNLSTKNVFEYRAKSDLEQNRGVMGILPVPKGVEAGKLVATFTGLCFVELRVKKGLGYFCDLSKYSVNDSTYLFFKIEGPSNTIDSMQKGIKYMVNKIKKNLKQVNFKQGNRETEKAKQMLNPKSLKWLIYKLKND